MRALKSAARYFRMANNQGENGERAVPRERGERGGHHDATHPFFRFIRRLLVLKNNSGRVRFASTSFRIIAATRGVFGYTSRLDGLNRVGNLR